MLILLLKIELNFQETQPDIKVEGHDLFSVFSCFTVDSWNDLNEYICDLV